MLTDSRDSSNSRAHPHVFLNIYLVVRLAVANGRKSGLKRCWRGMACPKMNSLPTNGRLLLTRPAPNSRPRR